jgi:hypothetical protein
VPASQKEESILRSCCDQRRRIALFQVTMPGALLISAGAEGARNPEHHQLKLLTFFAVPKFNGHFV